MRPNNEDAVLTNGRLVVIADGMGGHKGGEIASGMAVATISETFAKSTLAGIDRLVETFRLANKAIFEQNQLDPRGGNMGTTCTAAWINDNRVSIAHVGDTRCYLIRRGELMQLTQDHSLGQDRLRRGLISKEQAEAYDQNILTRSLGTQQEVEIDADAHPLLPGDVLLLCSDGLNKEMTDDQILKIVIETRDPQAAVTRLIDLANASGGRDNISVAVARVEKPGILESILRTLGLKQG